MTSERVKAIEERLEKATPGCGNCGAPLVGRTSRARYCTRTCKERHYQRTAGKAARNARGSRFRQTEHGKAISAKITRAQYRKHREKALARAAVNDAVKRGRLYRPGSCERCAATCSPDAHHHRGYETAHRLEVQWLCRTCHSAEHHASETP